MKRQAFVALGKTSIGVVRLVRLSNSVPASLLVLIGAYLTNGWPLSRAAWQAAAAMWCVTAFGYTSNDIFDLTEDQINKPDRPLPAGVVSRTGAVVLTGVLALGALAFSGPIGLFAPTAALIVLGLLTLYNVRLKATPGGGNGLIALLAGCTLLVGGVAVRGLRPQAFQLLIAPALVLTSFIAAREILKTVEDAKGDQLAGKQTLATQLGPQGVRQIIAALGLLTTLLSLLPVFQLGYSWLYLALITLGVDLPLLFTPFYLGREASQPRVRFCLALLKASYFAGILALLLA